MSATAKSVLDSPRKVRRVIGERGFIGVGAGGDADAAGTVAHLQTVEGPAGAAAADLGNLNARALAQAIHRFFDENGFFWVNTPIITASDAEGAGEHVAVQGFAEAGVDDSDLEAFR